MNTTLAPRCLAKKSGFTLVELLVVIAIIAILASIILYAGSAAINASKRLKSANYIQQIQTGVQNYYTEYSVYPVPSGATTDYMISDSNVATGGTASWGPLMECLCGMVSPSTGAVSTETTFTNTRVIPFIQGLRTTDVANGTTTGSVTDAPLNALQPNTTQLYFNIAIDSAYAGVLGAGDPNGTSSAWLPKFTPATPSGFPATGNSGGGGTTTSGVALWVNCNTKTTSNSSFWRSTF